MPRLRRDGPALDTIDGSTPIRRQEDRKKNATKPRYAQSFRKSAKWPVRSLVVNLTVHKTAEHIFRRPPCASPPVRGRSAFSGRNRARARDFWSPTPPPPHSPPPPPVLFSLSLDPACRRRRRPSRARGSAAVARALRPGTLRSRPFPPRVASSFREQVALAPLPVGSFVPLPSRAPPLPPVTMPKRGIHPLVHSAKLVLRNGASINIQSVYKFANPIRLQVVRAGLEWARGRRGA